MTDKPKEVKRRTPPVPVQVLERHNKSVLVQWNEGTNTDPDIKRGTIPREMVVEDQVARATLDAALPYGEDWAALLPTITLEPEAFSRRLHARGVFTLDEWARGSNVIMRVLFELCGIRDITRKAKE